ncbi:MAG: hypothetical protein OXQ29_16255 [Rhodospirillaceae bacterium]|nr:hypothetical protein [Rhodospirillaceae bacterium]
MRGAGPIVDGLGRRTGLVLVGFVFGLPVAWADRADLEGTWLQLSAGRPTATLTPVAERAVADYVPLRDDPDLRCQPPSLTNVIGIPDPPWEIRLFDDRVEFDFEYMDVRRRAPLDPDLNVADAPYTVEDHPHMGRSVARFEGDELIIDTSDVGRGYVDTRGPAEGFPQSTGMRYEERYRADGDRLYVEIMHTDPVYYVEPFSMSFEFLRVDLEVLEFDCQIDAANYDDRL